MDFYDSIYQYDLEMENKITKRLNNFLKFINILKNENPLNISNTGDMKYNHITTILEEIMNSTKFKSRLLLNKKKNLLLRMNNKTKVNSKYYIYAKNMNQNNHKMDIIEVKNNVMKKSTDSFELNNKRKEKSFDLDLIFNQKKINYEKNDGDENEEKNMLETLKSDINKIICDMIKQNVKNIYRRYLNEIILKNQNLNSSEKNNRENTDNENSDISLEKSKEIKNNNYVKIDLSKKEEKEKERKLHSNHSSEKNNFMKYLIDKNNINENQTNKDLRNSVTNNNGNNLKIKVCSDMILNFNNLNNGNTLNNLLIVNKKIKSVKNDNGNHNMKIKKRNKEKEEKKDIMDYTHKKNMFSNNNILINKSKNSEIEDESELKLGDLSQKKLAERNMQRIHIKNVKLKNNQIGYNLTNFRKKQISDLDNININNNEKKSTKNNKQKNMNYASPSDFIADGKKLNVLKFKLGKNYISPNRKNTEKSVKRNNNFENSIDKENSIKSLFDNKKKDNNENGVKFNSVRKKKLSDKVNSNNDLSQILLAKKQNENNFPIRNYKTNFNINNLNNNNQNNNNNNIIQILKESEADNIFIINRNNPVKKSLSKEINSQPQIPWHFSNSNANTIMNKSNNKGNVGKSYLNQILQIEKKNNANINNNNFEKNLKNEKKININKQNNIYKDIAIKNNKGINYQFVYEQKQEKSAKNRKLRNNLNNYGKIESYHDTIDNKGEPNSYRGVKIKGKRRILSTRVHIRGIKSSKNFKDIL